MYTQALDLDPKNIVLLSNRALAHTKMENFGLAIADAEVCVSIDRSYAKGFYRRGVAELGLGRFKEALRDFRVSAALRPNDRDAVTKLKHCESIVRRQAFEAAIAADDEPDIFDSVDWKGMALEEGYEGPKWEDEGITKEFVERTVESFSVGGRLPKRYMYRLLVESRAVLQNLSNVINVTIPRGQHMTVCGDTHGQFYDLLHIFEINDAPAVDNPYVFNGDYVDRGSWSVEVISTLLMYKCLYPHRCGCV